MATIDSPPSPSNPDDDLLPTATLALPSTAASSRRLPPPCWSADETVALIDAYRDKWYSLRRGNLRANHWQEVADDVASRCPTSSTKTAVQCRHKMEKLRKRYRAEIQRSAEHGGARRFSSSSWEHFQKMHTMERGPNPTPPSSSDEEDDEHQNQSSVKRIRDLYNHNHKSVSVAELENNGAPSGFRIKIPGRMVPGPSNSIPKFTTPLDTKNPNHHGFGVNGAASASNKLPREGLSGGIRQVPKKESRKDANPGFDELVGAMNTLVDGFARTEMAKMEILMQVDEMRRELERKRMEMLLEWQQMILEEMGDGKRARRSFTPPGS